jgi:hypothetical protein
MGSVRVRVRVRVRESASERPRTLRMELLRELTADAAYASTALMSTSCAVTILREFKSAPGYEDGLAGILRSGHSGFWDVVIGEICSGDDGRGEVFGGAGSVLMVPPRHAATPEFPRASTLYDLS